MNVATHLRQMVYKRNPSLVYKSPTYQMNPNYYVDGMLVQPKNNVLPVEKSK